MQSGPIGLIAGGGRLPLLVAGALSAAGRNVHILKLEGQACLLEAGETLSLGQVGRMFKSLKAAQVKQLVLCGAVATPDMKTLKLDPRGMLLLPSAMAAAQKGEDGLMRLIAQTFSKEGYTLLRPDELVPDLAIPLGVLTDKSPSDAHRMDIARGVRELDVLGERDQGQACIISAEKLIAVESEAGTDAMLITCHAPHGGILVKGAKPGQTLLLDMPVVGPETIHHTASAGLSGVAVVAAGSLLVDRDEAIALANQMGLFIIGIER